jgi:hypothetical protein
VSRGAHLHAAAPRADDLDIRIGGSLFELIPEGEYDAVGVDWRTFKSFASTKLAVKFDVLVPDSGVEFGLRRVPLERYYNVRTGPERRIHAPARGDYLRDWCLVAGRRPSRHDRLSPRVFVGVLVRVAVASVMQDHRQHELGFNSYSKVARIIERRAGGGSL